MNGETLGNRRLILGIGNCLMSDDGIGVHAARLLARNPPANTTVLDVGTDFLSSVPALESHRAVLVIDAMDAGGIPGTIYRCGASAFEAQTPGASLHELNLLSMLEFLEPDQRPEIHFLGVQPARVTYGLELSPLLAGALPLVAQKARGVVRGL